MMIIFLWEIFNFITSCFVELKLKNLTHIKSSTCCVEKYHKRGDSCCCTKYLVFSFKPLLYTLHWGGLMEVSTSATCYCPTADLWPLCKRRLFFSQIENAIKYTKSVDFSASFGLNDALHRVFSQPNWTNLTFCSNAELKKVEKLQTYAVQTRCCPPPCRWCSCPGPAARPRPRSSSAASRSRSTRWRPWCQSPPDTGSPHDNSL